MSHNIARNTQILMIPETPIHGMQASPARDPRPTRRKLWTIFSFLADHEMFRIEWTSVR